jgi:LysM repeat protein
MAAKKPAKPRKFKQARKDAKSAAKQTFSGKSQARLKDATTKLTADDRIALQEMKDTAKAQLGKNAYLDPKEYKATQEAAREKFRASMREEGLYPEKKTDKPKLTKPLASQPGVKSTKKKAAVKKTAITRPLDSKPGVPKASKPATKGYAAGKQLNEMGQARYRELIKEGIEPKKALNKALFAQEKATKVSGNAGTTAKPKPGLMGQIKKDVAKQKAAITRPLDSQPGVKKASTGIAAGGELKTPSQVATYKDAVKRGIPKGEAMRIAQGKTTGTSLAVKGKEVATTGSKPAAAAAGKKKFGKTKAVGKGLLYTALASEVVSAVKGSSEKDFKEIQRLENKLASLKGQAPKYKNMGSNKNPISVLKTDAGNLAALASMGAVGKTRRSRMDELNAKIEKAQAKKNVAIAKGRAAKPGVSAPGRSSSKINTTFKQASAAPAAGAGGSTIKQGSEYRVKSGDTLSGIAKTAGVSLNDIMSANEKFKKNAKYKGGNMIFARTKVNIPKKK